MGKGWNEEWEPRHWLRARPNSRRAGYGEDRGSGEEVRLAVAEKGEKEGAVGRRRGMTGGPGLSAGERGEGRR